MWPPGHTAEQALVLSAAVAGSEPPRSPEVPPQLALQVSLDPQLPAGPPPWAGTVSSVPPRPPKTSG